MAGKSKVKVPKRIMGTKIPKDIRKNLKRLIRSVEAHGIASLVAVTVGTWLISKLGINMPGEKHDTATAH